ncbi:MAG TPA: phosphate ABC transporter substrate-binding protein [Clostridiales bacterium]|nr:phosphate ABC transporter substrate-binding protein [Clostridiales bacterium]
MKRIKTIALFLIGLLALTYFTGCVERGFDENSDITVISREDGSGTRGAFVELFGVEQRDESGEKIDATVPTADITQSTGVMMTSVSLNTSAIGYISLGSMNERIKALKIDNAEASIENIKSGSYKISRPFNIVTKDNLSEVAQDFIKFILSSEGQKVVEDSGYIAASDKAAYDGTKPSGKIAIAGSSSVSPVMEKLKEAYLAINTNATIEINQSDSTTGVNSVIEDICDIGLASRELKESEISSGLTATPIAIDGIVVIVNNKNTVDNLSVEQVRKIYMGEITKWSEISNKSKDE